jgi:hypothetical protein
MQKSFAPADEENEKARLVELELEPRVRRSRSSISSMFVPRRLPSIYGNKETYEGFRHENDWMTVKRNNTAFCILIKDLHPAKLTMLSRTKTKELWSKGVSSWFEFCNVSKIVSSSMKLLLVHISTIIALFPRVRFFSTIERIIA